MSPRAEVRARELHRRGVLLQNRGYPARAIRVLEQSRALLDEAAGDGNERARLLTEVWISLALNYAEVSGADAGFTALAEARRRSDALGDPRMSVRVHSQHAFIAMRAGRYDVAAQELADAETGLEYADENDSFAILLNAGLLGLYNEDLGTARRYLRRAADFARTHDFRTGEFKALHNLGYLEFLAGDLPSALRLMDEAGQIDVDVSLGIWHLDRARVLAAAGLLREADNDLAAAGRIFARARSWQDLAETELERARCALIADDARAARRLAARARDRFRSRGNRAWLRTAELVLLHGDLRAGRPGGRLVAPALRLYEAFGADGLDLAARSAALIAVSAYVRSRQLGRAQELAASVGAATPRDPITARLQDRQVRAELAAATGRRTDAVRQVRTGLADLARHQASFGSIDLQTSAAVHGRRLAEMGIAMALQGGRPAEVLTAAERGRAVSARLPVVRPPEDPVAAELLAELRQTVESLHAVAQDARASAPLQRTRRDLERRILARGWTVEGAGGAAATVTLREVRAELRAATSQLAYFVDVSGVLHAVVVGDRVRLHALGPSAPVVEYVRRVRADLDVAAQPLLPPPLRNAVEQSLAGSLAALDDAIVRPLSLTSERVVMVTTGLLGQVPWNALPSLCGRPVVAAPSATAWVHATRRPDSPRSGCVALRGPDLERSGIETATIARTWSDRPPTDVAATRTSVRAALSDAELVHIAAHGTHQTENPLFSSLRLDDGLLFAHELDLSMRTPAHVVLSACELGLATVRPGDEALGLTSVLLRTGTTAVVAGVARVNDELAAATMIDYHHRLAGGLDTAAALAEAVAAADGPAPFVCFGASWAASTPRGFGGRRDRRVP